MLSLYSNFWIKYITLGIYLYAKWKSVPLACGSWAMVHYLLPALGIYPKNLGVSDALCIVEKEKGIKRYPHWIGNLKLVLLSLFQLFLLKSIVRRMVLCFLHIEMTISNDCYHVGRTSSGTLPNSIWRESLFRPGR